MVEGSGCQMSKNAVVQLCVDARELGGAVASIGRGLLPPDTREQNEVPFALTHAEREYCRMCVAELLKRRAPGGEGALIEPCEVGLGEQALRAVAHRLKGIEESDEILRHAVILVCPDVLRTIDLAIGIRGYYPHRDPPRRPWSGAEEVCEEALSIRLAAYRKARVPGASPLVVNASAVVPRPMAMTRSEAILVLEAVRRSLLTLEMCSRKDIGIVMNASLAEVEQLPDKLARLEHHLLGELRAISASEGL